MPACRVRYATWALVAGLLIAVAPFAHAGPKGPTPVPAPAAQVPVDVETAEQLYAKLDYEQANATAERVTKQRGLSHDQLVRAYRVLAVTNAVLDREEAAREAFVLLLTFDAEYQIDQNLGPKVSNPFIEARGFWRAQSVKPGIEVTPVLRAQEGGTLRVGLRDPTKIVKKVHVGYRWASSGEYVSSAVAPGEGVTVEVSSPPAGKTRLDYYVQGLDDRDNVVLESGNPGVPKSAFAEGNAGKGGAAKASGSMFASPVFWTIAGVLVAGGATTLILVTRPKDAPTSATLGPALNCGGDRCN